MLTALLIGALAALLAGVAYQIIGAARGGRLHRAPGTMVDVGGYRLHARCAGAGSPTVILESGIAASSLSWSLVQPRVFEFARVCSYDRAGLAWSQSAPHPRTMRQIVDELRRLLAAADIPGPYVLVGHSFGGLVVRAYADRHPDEVAGLVLVDAIHPDEWLALTGDQQRILRGGVLFSRLGEVLARLGVVRLCLALLAGGAPGAPRAFIRIFGPRVVALLERVVGEVRKLPADALPAVREHWSQPKCFRAMAGYLACLPASAADVAACGSLGDKPMVVLSAPTHNGPRAAEQRALAQLSSNARHVIAEKSGHWIQLDQPDLVVEAIRSVVEAVRSGRRLDRDLRVSSFSDQQ